MNSVFLLSAHLLIYHKPSCRFREHILSIKNFNDCELNKHFLHPGGNTKVKFISGIGVRSSNSMVNVWFQSKNWFVAFVIWKILRQFIQWQSQCWMESIITQSCEDCKSIDCELSRIQFAWNASNLSRAFSRIGYMNFQSRTSHCTRTYMYVIRRILLY